MGELEIPVLDVAPLLAIGTSETERARLVDRLAAQLGRACARVGFLKLTGCGTVVSPALVDEVFEMTERFHDLDLPIKLKLGLDPPTMRGTCCRSRPVATYVERSHDSLTYRLSPNDVDVMSDKTHGNARNLNVKDLERSFTATSGPGTRMSFLLTIP